jgi:hypothetical protein
MGAIKGSMREEMPVTAAFIDRMRQAFGAEHIDGQIRKGMKGEPVFWASENGQEVGTKGRSGWKVIKDKSGNRTIAVDGNGKRWRYEDGQYRPETEAERDQ